MKPAFFFVLLVAVTLLVVSVLSYRNTDEQTARAKREKIQRASAGLPNPNP